MALKDISLDVGLNVNNAVKDARNLNKELNAMFKVTSDKDLSSKVMGVTNRIEKQQYTLQKMAEKLQGMNAPTEQYQRLEAAAINYYKKIQVEEAKIAKWREQGYVGHGRGKLTGEQMDTHIANAEARVEKLNSALVIAQSEMQTLTEQGKAFTFAGNEEKVNDLIAKMGFLQNAITKNVMSLYEGDQALAEAVYKSDDLTSALDNTAASSKWIAERFHEASMAEQEAADGIGQADMNMAQFASRAAMLSSVQSVAQGIANGFRTIGSTVSSIISGVKKIASALKTVASKVKGVIKHFKLLNKESSSHNLNLKKGLNTMLKYGLGIRSVFILWRKLRAYATDALKLMAQQFTEIDKVVSDIINSFNQFKNSVGTAVQPLMTAFAPALVHVLGLLTKMNEAIAHFFAILTGQKYIYKAKKANDSYAESLKKTGSSAKEAGKDIASYDKLLVINKDTGNGGGSGSGDAEETVDAFQKTLAHSDFAEQLKAAIAAGDWEGVGALFGQKLNIVSAAFDSWINGTFRPAAVEWGSNIARIINGFFGEVEWDSLGTTFGDGINAIVAGINSFQDTIDAFTIGSSLGEFVQSLADTVEWDDIGHMIAQFFNNVGDSIRGFTESVNELELGGDVAETVNSFVYDFEWGENTQAVSDATIGLMDFFIGVIEGIDTDSIDYVLEEVLGNIDFGGILERAFEFAGFIQGLPLKILLEIGEAIADGVSSIADYFSDEIDEAGGNIILGILKGIGDAILGIGQWIYDHIFKPFIDGFKSAFGISSPSTVMAEQGGFIISGLFKGILTVFNSLKGILVSIKEWVVGVFSAIGKKVVYFVNLIGKKLAPILNSIKKLFSTVFGKIKEIVVPIAEFISEKVVGAVKSIKSGIKKPLNAIIGFLNTLIDGFISAVNFVIDALNNLSFDVPDWVPGIGGETFGFDIKRLDAESYQIPKLAQGAVIPANNEFLAVLGDQKRGTNIEAPLDTIKQALAEVLAEMGSGTKDEINLNLDGKTIAKVVWDENQKKYKQTGVRYA